MLTTCFEPFAKRTAKGIYTFAIVPTTWQDTLSYIPVNVNIAEESSKYVQTGRRYITLKEQKESKPFTFLVLTLIVFADIQKEDRPDVQEGIVQRGDIPQGKTNTLALKRNMCSFYYDS